MNTSYDYQALIKDTVIDLLTRMGFAAEAEVVCVDTETLSFFCSLKVSQDQNFLIGQYGVNLAAIQHIIRVIIRKKTGEKLNIVVDVNDYFSGKKTLLEKEAKKALDEALQNNISVAMRPMLPYERKIVHGFLSSQGSVTTESIGKGDDRKVIVRPKPVQENDTL